MSIPLLSLLYCLIIWMKSHPVIFNISNKSSLNMLYSSYFFSLTTHPILIFIITAPMSTKWNFQSISMEWHADYGGLFDTLTLHRLNPRCGRTAFVTICGWHIARGGGLDMQDAKCFSLKYALCQNYFHWLCINCLEQRMHLCKYIYIYAKNSHILRQHCNNYASMQKVS